MFAGMLGRRAAVLTVLALSAIASSSCGDDGAEPSDPADAIVTMTIAAGGGSVVVSKVTGGVTGGGSLVIGAGTTPVTITFQDAAGADVTDLGEFEVQGTPANAALVTYAKNGLGGALTKVAAGSTTIRFGLYHVAEGHFDFGPYEVPITIQ